MDQTEKTYKTQIVKAVITFLRLFMCETLAKRIVSMLLLVSGIPNKQITELTGLCDKSVRTLKKSIESGEHENLFKTNIVGQKGKLADIETEIINEINKNDYSSQQQIADMVNEKYGVKVTQSTISRLLKKNGIKRLKCGSLPAKADVEEQREFYEAVLHPLMQMANMGTIELLFMDASHFVMGCDFLG